MKFKPKFSGEWYGVMCNAGATIDLDGNLARKAESQPDLFSKLGRPKKNDGDDS